MKLVFKLLAVLLMFSSCGNVTVSGKNTVEELGTEILPPPPPPPPPRPEAAPIVLRVFQSQNTIKLIGSRLNNSINLSNLNAIYEKNFSYAGFWGSGSPDIALSKISDLNRDGYDDYCLSYKEANSQFINISINTVNGETLDEVRQEHGGACAQVNNQQQLIQIIEKFNFNSQGGMTNDPAVKVLQIFDKQTQALIKRQEISVKSIDASFDNLVSGEIIDDINNDGYDDILFSTYKSIPNSFKYKVLTFILSGKTLDANQPLLNFQSEADPRWMHKIHFSRKHLTAWIDSNEEVLTVFQRRPSGVYEVSRTFTAPQGLYFSQSVFGDGYKNKDLTNATEISFNICTGKHVFNFRECNLANFNLSSGEIRVGDFSQFIGHRPEQQKGLYTFSRIETADDLVGCSSTVIDFNNTIYATQLYSEKNKKILEHVLAPDGFWPTACVIAREVR